MKKKITYIANLAKNKFLLFLSKIFKSNIQKVLNNKFLFISALLIGLLLRLPQKIIALQLEIVYFNSFALYMGFVYAIVILYRQVYTDFYPFSPKIFIKNVILGFLIFKLFTSFFNLTVLIALFSHLIDYSIILYHPFIELACLWWSDFRNQSVCYVASPELGLDEIEAAIPDMDTVFPNDHHHTRDYPYNPQLDLNADPINTTYRRRNTGYWGGIINGYFLDQLLDRDTQWDHTHKQFKNNVTMIKEKSNVWTHLRSFYNVDITDKTVTIFDPFIAHTNIQPSIDVDGLIDHDTGIKVLLDPLKTEYRTLTSGLEFVRLKNLCLRLIDEKHIRVIEVQNEIRNNGKALNSRRNRADLANAWHEFLAVKHHYELNFKNRTSFAR